MARPAIDPQSLGHVDARQCGRTIIGVVVAVLVIGLALFLLMPSLSNHRRPAGHMKNTTQLRGIHWSAVLYSQSNNSYLPGLDAAGDMMDPSPQGRFQLLLNGGYFFGDLLLNPYDRYVVKWTSGRVTPAHYSYASLEIFGPGRRAEWRDNGNSEALMYSDRALGPDAAGVYRNPWSNAKPKGADRRFPDHWTGGVVWGDNHAEWLQSHLVSTRYLQNATTLDDPFANETPDGADALLIHGYP